MSSRTSIILTIIGFIFFIFGMLALLLSMMDLRLIAMDWITESLGRGGALIVHLCMVISGIVMTVAARGNFAGEDPVPIDRD